MKRPSLPVDAPTYRRLLGSFATGVTVVTAADDRGGVAGMTASAVAAVSLEPPLLLVCVGHEASMHDMLHAAPLFALNVLASDQEVVSRRFADAAADRFRDVAFHRDPSGLPLLDGAVAHIICERERSYPAGDHTVFFGRVVDGAAFDRAPLLHFRGGYRGLPLDP